jgi:hypothetical protein
LRCNRCGDIYCQSCRHCWPARVEPTRELAIEYDDWRTTDRCSCFQGIIPHARSHASFSEHPSLSVQLSRV